MNEHLDSSLDDFLKEVGILEDAITLATARVRIWQAGKQAQTINGPTARTSPDRQNGHAEETTYH